MNTVIDADPAPGPGDPRAVPKVRTKPSATRSIVDRTIIRAALVESIRKLDPRAMARNPVMFVVEIGAAFSTVLFLRDLGDTDTQGNVFAGLVSLFLWATVCSPTSPRRWPKAVARRRPPHCGPPAPTRRPTCSDQTDPSLPTPSSELHIGDRCVVTRRRGDPG